MTTPGTADVVLDDLPASSAALAAAPSAPAEVDARKVKRRKLRKPGSKIPGTKVPRAALAAAGVTKRRGPGTKLQTQVPRAWRAEITKLARRQGVRESDILREFIRRGLGINKKDALTIGIQA